MSLKKILNCVGTLLVAFFLPCVPASAQDRGTAEEAQAMVTAAIGYYEANGNNATIMAVNADDPAFHRGDLYIFMLTADGMIVAHPIDHSLIGVDGTTLKDADGKAFVQEFVTKADTAGVWVDYKWKNPSTGEVAAKSSWIVLHDDYIFGAGIYLP